MTEDMARMAAKLTVKASDCGIPPHMVEGLVAYVVTGRPVGDFLTAVLENNLKEACGRADELNKHILFEYVFFLYNYSPMGCWGSPDRVASWRERKGLYNIQPAAEPDPRD